MYLSMNNHHTRMRKHTIAILLAAASVLACTPEIDNVPFTQTDDYYLSISDNMLDTGSWQVGDEVLLLSSIGSDMLTATAAGKKVKFSRKGSNQLKNPVAGVFPSSIEASFNGNTISMKLPVSQDPQAPLAGIFAGKSSNKTLVLDAVTGRVTFNLAGDVQYRSISLKGLADERIAGVFSFSNGAISIGNETVITLEGQALGKGMYSFCVVPNTFSKGLQLTLTRADGSTDVLSYKGRVKVEAGQTFHIGSSDEEALQGGETPEVIPTEGRTLKFDFSHAPAGWPTASASGRYSISQNGETLDFVLLNTYYNTSSGYLSITGTSNSLGLPALKQYRLVRIVLTPGAAASKHVCKVTCSYGGSVEPKGGASQAFDANRDYVWDLQDTEENTVYYLTSANQGVPIKALTLTYEPCASKISRMNTFNHPRLLMNDSEFNGLKATLQNAAADSPLRQLHDLAMKIADDTVAGEDIVLTFDGSKRMLATSRSALQRIFNCAYAYRVTGETKYLERAERDLLTVAAYTDWNGAAHFLDVGEMSAGVAMGYDWLYNDLQESTLRAVEKAFLNYAVMNVYKRSWNLNFFTNVGNWEQVCCGGLCAGALAMYEAFPSDAQFLLDRIRYSNLEIAPRLYGENGNYPEGYGYWEYGTSYQALLDLCMQSAAGDDSFANPQGLDKTSSYYMFMEGPSGMCYNYSDTSPNSNSPAQALWYLAAKYSNPSLVIGEISKIGTLYGKGDTPRLLPMTILNASKLDLSSLREPAERLYVGEGENPVVVMRNGWSGTETDLYVGFKGGKASNNHGHMDAGSFIMDYRKARWAYDFVRPAYANIETALKNAGGDFWSLSQSSLRWQVNVMNNLNHNTLTINGAQHIVGGKATIEEVISTDSETGGRMNLTPVFSGNAESVRRTVKVVGTGTVHVIDEIKALSTKAADVEWRMVSAAVPTVNTGNIQLRQNNYNMFISTKSSPEVKFTEFSNAKVKSWDSDISKYHVVGWQYTVPAGQSVTVTTVISPAP